MKSITQTTSFGALAVLAMLGMILVPFSASAATYLDPFTATEVALYTQDRTTPSGGYESLANYAGRTDVLEMRIDKDNRSDSGPFHYTEGLQKQINPTQELGVDMFVDSAWENIDVRSGLWGVASDGDDITAYPIIEFSTKRADDSTGWRYWNGSGWVNLSTAYTYDAWASLYIEITDTAIDFTINGVEVGSMPLDGSIEFNAVILNAYNYGADAASYSTHWHIGLTTPVVKADCLNNGWKASGFKNQGQCVRFVETGKDSR